MKDRHRLIGNKTNAESKTYGNACDACTDSKVVGYVKGACKPGQ
jgi:hypothetical protein